MPSLKDIRRRITTVKKTQQITRAMRMVAGAKLRGAEEAIVAARPYSDQMRDTLADRPHRVLIDERPMRYYVEQVVTRLKANPSLSLRALVGTFAHDSREALVGSFCALLELVRLEVIQVEQAEPRADIHIRVRAERLGELEDVVRNTRFDEEVPSESATQPQPAQLELVLDDAGLDDEALEGDGLDETDEPSHS